MFITGGEKLVQSLQIFYFWIFPFLPQLNFSILAILKTTNFNLLEKA